MASEAPSPKISIKIGLLQARTGWRPLDSLARGTAFVPMRSQGPVCAPILRGKAPKCEKNYGGVVKPDFFSVSVRVNQARLYPVPKYGEIFLYTTVIR